MEAPLMMLWVLLAAAGVVTGGPLGIAAGVLALGFGVIAVNARRRSS
jgi:hypothetical protein